MCVPGACLPASHSTAMAPLPASKQRPNLHGNPAAFAIRVLVDALRILAHLVHSKGFGRTLPFRSQKRGTPAAASRPHLCARASAVHSMAACACLVSTNGDCASSRPPSALRRPHRDPGVLSTTDFSSWSDEIFPTCICSRISGFRGDGSGVSAAGLATGRTLSPGRKNPS